jgi:signal transduction histidine kinase
MLMPPPDCHEHDQYLRNYLQTGRARIIGIGREVVGRRKNGERFPMDLSVSESRSDQWRFFTGIVRDITEKRRAQETIQRHREDMEKFLSIVAHDLKNPTANVITLLKMFKADHSDSLSGDGRRFIGDAIAEGERMFEIIDQLNAIARIGQADIRLKRVDLRELINRTVSRHELMIHERKVMLHVECPGIELEIAAVQVEEALINLIDNALKYGCPPSTEPAWA